MKKITHLINGLDSGGAETVLVRLILNDSQGNKHLVISLKDDGFYGKQLKENGVTVKSLELNKPHNVIFGIGVFKLLNLLRKNKTDTLIAWMPHSCLLGGLVGKICGIKKIIWNFRGASENLNDNTKLHHIVLFTCKKLQKYIPNKIIVCANYVNDVLGNYGFETSNIKVIFNGYDSNEYSINNKSRKEIRKELQVPKDIPLLGMIARWHPQKNHGLLIESLKLIKSRNLEFRCLLLGEGIQNELILESISKLGMSDFFILRNETKNIPAILNALDIHILSSKFGEGFPNVIAEAMLCGTPCIATDIGDSELIVGQTGWISKNDSVSEMSDKIFKAIEYWKDKKAWHNKSNEARNRIIKNFHISSMINNYQNIY